MPKRKLIRQSNFPYHITSRNNHKDWFSIPIYEVWDICKEAFIYAQSKEYAEINCFVLMSNHYHLLITTPKENIDKFMMHYNWKISSLITEKSNIINHKFSNRYRWSIVDNQNYLKNVYRYIYQNPVRANLTHKCHAYPYSSIHFSRFEAKKINYQPHFQYSSEKSYIEKRFGSDFENIIQRSLRKAYFRPHQKISKVQKNRLNNLPN